MGRQGARTVGAEVKRTPSSVDSAAAFRITLIFPRRGEWRLRLFAGNRRFAFPAVDVGGGRAPEDYVAFPIGSRMEGEGGDFSPNAVPVNHPVSPPAARPTSNRIAYDVHII